MHNSIKRGRYVAIAFEWFTHRKNNLERIGLFALILGWEREAMNKPFCDLPFTQSCLGRGLKQALRFILFHHSQTL